MGNTQGGPVHRRDRRREMTFLFYFVFGFVLIRVWILLIQSNNIVVEAVGGVITFLLLFSLCMRYRIIRQQQQELERNPHNGNEEVNNPDLALLQSLFRTPNRGLSNDVINSLYWFYYSPDPPDGVAGNSAEKGNEHGGNVGSQQDSVLHNVASDLESPAPRHSTGGSGTDGTSCACSICLSDYMPGDVVLMLPCRHMYHRTCVTEWLVAHTQCPLCKQDVLELLEQEDYVHSQIARLRQISAERETQQGLPLSHIVYEADGESASPVRASAAAAASGGSLPTPPGRVQASGSAGEPGIVAATSGTSVDDVSP